MWFKYQKHGDDILKGISLKVPQGSIFALMGGNGVGKTTALSVLAGIRKPYRGKVRLLIKTSAATKTVSGFGAA